MKHSDLKTADALHFAKFRTFAGNPLAIAPDFANQILSAIDTNKIYRATGTTLGAMVELVGASDGDGGSPPEINTAAFLNKILIANGEILTTESTIIYQE